jgi:hypothetical protein
MKTLIPAVFFQKQLKGSTAAVQIPEKLEMFENELDEVVGGVRNVSAGNVGGVAGMRRYDDGSGGSVTFSYSAGWLDVEQADDCAA